jgi:hypothetical protein
VILSDRMIREARMADWTLPKPRLALLLDHLAVVEDARQSWRVM